MALNGSLAGAGRQWLPGGTPGTEVASMAVAVTVKFLACSARWPQQLGVFLTRPVLWRGFRHFSWE